MNARPMDPILLVGSILLIAAALTWVVPAGHYQRRHDPKTGQNLVVPGSYRSAPRQPVGLRLEQVTPTATPLHLFEAVPSQPTEYVLFQR